MFLTDANGQIHACMVRPMLTRGPWTDRVVRIDDLPVKLHFLQGGKMGYYRWDNRWYRVNLDELGKSTELKTRKKKGGLALD